MFLLRYLEVSVIGVIESLLQPRVASLPAHIQATYIQAVIKLFVSIVGGSKGPEVPLIQNPSSASDDNQNQ